MADPSEPLTAGTIWQETLAALRPDFGTLFAVVAPFTLLVSVALDLFGPPQPDKLADFTPRTLILLGLLPSLVGAIGQLALVRLVLRPGETAGAALAAGLAATPAWAGAALLSALPLGLAFLMLFVPGLYLSARLFLVAPAAVIERRGPVAALTRSWELTGTVAWPLVLFFVLAIFGILGTSVLAMGLGGAVGSVLVLTGSKGAADFAVALVPALLSTLIAMAGAAASAVVWRRVAG